MPNNHPKHTSTLIQSPLNYTGSKFRLLAQILPLFPKNMSIMLDLFCGGGSVGVNVEAKNIIMNDKLKELIDILDLFKNCDLKDILQEIARIIKNAGLSHTAEFGYEFYHCSSSVGVANYNKKAFNKLKDEYNKNKNPILLF